MKTLNLLFFIVAVSAEDFNLNNEEMKGFIRQGIVSWSDSFWNFFDEPTDIRGKNMLCIENVYLIKMSKVEVCLTKNFLNNY
jgi:hypothetical protein